MSYILKAAVRRLRPDPFVGHPGAVSVRSPPQARHNPAPAAGLARDGTRPSFQLIQADRPRSSAPCQPHRPRVAACTAPRISASIHTKAVAGWITETEAERSSYELARRQTTTRTRMSEAEIRAIVDKLADIAGAHRCRPRRQGRDLPPAWPQADLPPRKARSESRDQLGPLWVFDGVRGPSAPNSQHLAPLLITEFALDPVGGAR
jgi:hypothetical protein